VVWQHKLVFEVAKDLGELSIYCGSELARESGVSSNDGVESADAFASKLAPTGFRHGWGFVVWQQRLVFEVAGDLAGIIYLLWERAYSRKRSARR